MSSAQPIVPAAALPSEEFVEEVRSAVDHLYDSAFLHNHPLAWRLCGGAPTTGVTRTQRLRTLLLDAIEQLRPQERLAADAMRGYAILTYRCMDSLPMDEIAARLGLSRRQAYREYAKGVEAVAGFVWDALPPQLIASTADRASPAAAPDVVAADETAVAPLPTRLDAATDEVARLTANLLLEDVDLLALVEDAAALLSPRTHHTEVRLLITPQTTPLTIVADRVLLRQALLSLFSYALDRSPRGGAVTVTWMKAGSGAGFALVTAADQSPAHREGVGINVAQRLIEAMGGQAQVEQGEGEWRCTLSLPDAQRNTVLVVDDNADLTSLFQRYAAGQRLTIVGASNGPQALALAAELRPQLILLDLMLPQMDGWEILQQLRAAAATHTTPIVICSVLRELDLALSLGASDYVTKPISQATLVNVLRRWLGKQHPAA